MKAHKIALSLSGGGHLLPYHLAVCHSLINASKSTSFPPIHAISGSSSGAIAAVVASRMPDRIQEYAQQFIQERGNALSILENYLSSISSSDFNDTSSSSSCRPKLYICTTKCEDGSVRLFSGKELVKKEELLKCVRASCTIPQLFHPVDVLASSGDLSYPNEDGISIQGDSYVDGGISAPAPPVPDCFEGTVIVVSPISGSNNESSLRISPEDTSFAIWKDFICRGDFFVRPSIQNLRALRVASGSTTTGELQSWYEQGKEDANRFLNEWEKVEG